MMTNEQIERAQYELVFGLTGGELEDKPWGDHAHWYEGVPAYAESDFKDWALRSYRTVLAWGIPSEPPEAGWEFVRYYSTSGETECWCKDDGPDPTCELCEGDGYVYIGDGYGEAVYREVEEDPEDD